MAGTSSKIPIEIVSNEGLASVDAALASAACCSTPISGAKPGIHSPTPTSHLNRDVISIHSVSIQAKRRLFTCAEADIEDYGNLLSTEKKYRATNTFFYRFRSKRGLFVTDVTKTEWCEKQMEFSLLFEELKNNEANPCEEEARVFGGGRKCNNEAIQAGIDRHVQLQQEVLKPVNVNAKSREDIMALKLVNFINGVNQLLLEGLTRELPIVSLDFAQGIWMVGKIDEVRMPKAKMDHNPILVEIKTRFYDTVPSEPQKRNGMIQLMCYKYMWDNLVSHAHHDFPSKQLFYYFELNPKRALCEDLVAACVDSGISALTLGEVVTCYQNTCKMLPPAHDMLVLRYESQSDQSLLDENIFPYDDDCIKSEIQTCLEFWLGDREGSYIAEGEEWKCENCYFASECPAYIDAESTETFSDDDSCEWEEM